MHCENKINNGNDENNIRRDDKLLRIKARSIGQN